MGKLFCLQYYENIILNNIIFLLFFFLCNYYFNYLEVWWYICTDVIVHNVRFLDVIEHLIIALMLLC